MTIIQKYRVQLLSVGWTLLFFLVLGLITLPLIFISRANGWEIEIYHQALIVVVANAVSQFLMRKNFQELTGMINSRWVSGLFRGFIIGAALMIFPALFLYLTGAADWTMTSIKSGTICKAIIMFFCVAVAEEFLFRGFIFQRLNEGFGLISAQIITSGYFLLTHLNNPNMPGTTILLPSINIFLASILFGYAFIKTKSLALPIGIHFMANLVQGTVLGFGVSGHEQESLMNPDLKQSPNWLTGGDFGLEASVPGLVILVLTLISLWWARNTQN